MKAQYVGSIGYNIELVREWRESEARGGIEWVCGKSQVWKRIGTA